MSAPLRDELARVDPEVDGWQSETLGANVAAKLKQLGEVISAATTSEAVGKELVNEKFNCGSLRPSQVTTAFEDERVKVTRWHDDIATSEDSGVRYRGTDGLASAIKALTAPWADTANIHTHFKVVRVNVNGPTASTTVYVQLDSPTRTGCVQQNAVWTCVWDTTDETAPRLTAIAVEDFEEVVSTTAGGRLFTESTSAVLGRNRSYWDQLTYGIDHWRDRLDWRLGVEIAGHHGLAIGDVNGDGLDDLFLCQPGGMPSRLYLQQADGTARRHLRPSGR